MDIHVYMSISSFAKYDVDINFFEKKTCKFTWPKLIISFNRIQLDRSCKCGLPGLNIEAKRSGLFAC